MALQLPRKLSTLKEFERETPLAPQLPYWDFIGDTAVLADGTLVQGYRLNGVSIETWDEERINQLVLALRSVLNSLPDGCEISFWQQTDSDFKELIDQHEALAKDQGLARWVATTRADSLRTAAENADLLKSSLYLFVYQRFQSSGGAKPSFIRSFISSPKSFQTISKESHERSARELLQTADAVCASLRASLIEARALSAGELTDLIYRTINPERSKANTGPTLTSTHREQEFTTEELAVAPELVLDSPRHQLAFSDLIQGYESFLLDGHFHRVVTLKSLPEQTMAAMASKLRNLGFAHSLHVHVRVPEQSGELAQLQTKRRMAHSMSASSGGRASDLESESRLQSTEELLREIINTGQKVFYFQLAIVVQAKDRDELESKTRAVLSCVRELSGAEALAESVAGFKAWKTTLPAGTVSMLRPKRIKTDNLADFLPVYEPYAGTSRPVCLFRNRFGGLVRHDPHDASLPNYNTLVTGSSGSGKSFLNNLVLLQYATQKPFLFIIDIGGSYRKLCEFMGGQYIEIAPARADQTIKRINPFELPSGDTKPSPQKTKFILAMLENIFSEDSEKLAKLDRSLFEEAIVGLYEKIRARENRVPVLSDLATVLSNGSDARLRDFGRMLFPWTGERAYGRMLDGVNLLDLTSDVVVFDLKGLSSYPDLQSVMILILTDFILNRVESGTFDGRKKQILMDECWELLKSKASSQFMEYCVRTLRKTGSGITFITQGLEEIVASPVGSAILSNTATKYVLLQRGDLEPVRKILRLNSQEMALISSLRQEKGKYSEAFMIANEARSVIRMVPTPLEYWLATSDATDNAELESRRSAQPEKTLAEHLHELSTEMPFGVAGGKREAA